jgi:acyl-CoA thioesterase
MSQAALPKLLQLEALESGRYRVHHPEHDPEGRNIVFSGQLLAQMIMAADRAVEGAKDTKSIHAIFSRAASYEAPLELEVDTIQNGRTWASHTVTAHQSGKRMSRAMVLMSVDEPDLMSHGPGMPEVPGPDDLDPDPGSLAYPGAETRTVPDPAAVALDGSPAEHLWLRIDASLESVAARQAVLAWSQPGNGIALAMRPHADVVDIREAHRTLSTGVIAHTCHFHERFDLREWLLVTQQATWAGRGRVHGSGSVFNAEGRLVATFEQDSMVKAAGAPIDSKRGL